MDVTCEKSRGEIENTHQMNRESKTCAPFAQTRWTLIVTAQGADLAAEAAREELCRKYWYPLYAFIRRSGHSPHEAEDLTQGFFAHLFQRAWLDGVHQEKGRFRTYLLRCLTNYLTNEWKKGNGATRRPPGGFTPLEPGAGEVRYVRELMDHETPEVAFQRRWVMTVVEDAKALLRAEYERGGKQRLYDRLESHLAGRTDPGVHAGLAAELGMSEGAVRVHLHRLRKRFGELLRETVAQTVVHPADIEDEIRHLFAAWG